MNRNKKDTKGDRQFLQSLSSKDYIRAILLSIFSLGAYAFTAAPGITLEDSGDFVNGVLTLGIVHQPGYPFYTILGHLFSYLPLGEPAFRVNLFSALWGALCLGVLFLILRTLVVSTLHTTFTCLSLGLTTVFWSKTAVAEVYSFNVFLLASVVYWILSYNRDRERWQLYLAALTTGLALSNHYPLAILSGIGLVFLLDRKDLRFADYLKSSLLLVIGLTPYLYLFIQASNPDLQYNFAKISSPAMVLDHILRKVDHNQYGGTIFDKVVFGLWYLRTLTLDFLLTVVFILTGIIGSLSKRWPYRYPFLLAAVAPSFGLILLVTIPSHEGNRPLLADFAVPSYLFLSVFLAQGLEILSQRWKTTPSIYLAILLFLLFGQGALNFRTASHHNNKLVHLWAAELLNSLEPNSKLILCGPGSHAINYLHLTRGLRRDVTLYDRYSAYTKENLYAPKLLYKMRDKPQEYRKEREQHLIKETSAPVYYTCKGPIDEMGLPFSYTPYVLRVDRKHVAAAESARITPNNLLLDALVHGYPKSDFRVNHLRTMIWSRLISYHGGYNSAHLDQILEHFKTTKYYEEPTLVLSVANNLYYFKNYDLSKTLYEHADKLSLAAFDPTHLAVYCNLLANSRDYDNALRICLRQERYAATCEDNRINTQQTIAAIYREMQDWSKVARYARKILECHSNHTIAQSYLVEAEQNTP